MANSALQILSQRMTEDALATLAANTALFTDTLMTGITTNFLLKKVRAEMMVEALTANEPVIIGICSGAMTIAEIAAVLNASIFGPAEIDEVAQTKMIYWETLRVVTSLHPEYQIDQSLGGGKGIPQFEGVGWQWFAYNPSGGSLTTGALISGVAAYYGVWL